MRGDMKCVCKGAKIYFELDMRHRSLAVEAVPMGKSLTGSLTHARMRISPENAVGATHARI